MFFTSGMILAVVGTFFLADPIKQVKNIVQPQRIIAVIALVVSGVIYRIYFFEAPYVCTVFGLLPFEQYHNRSGFLET